MRIKAITAGLVLPVLFIAGIFISSAIGYWGTESLKEPTKFTTGIFEGEADPADIRGSYSFYDLEKAFDIPVNTLAKAFGFLSSENPGEVKLMEFKEVYGIIGDLEIGTSSMKLFVALYMGLPYDPEDDTAIPEPAWNLLNKEGKTDKETLSTYSWRIVSLEGFNVSKPEAIVEHTEEIVDKTIKGKTLFSDLLDWGLSGEQINAVIGVAMGEPGTTIRDFCTEQGIEFSTIKTSLQNLLVNM